jgi:hypothetical protein
MFPSLRDRFAIACFAMGYLSFTTFAPGLHRLEHVCESGAHAGPLATEVTKHVGAAASHCHKHHEQGGHRHRACPEGGTGAHDHSGHESAPGIPSHDDHDCFVCQQLAQKPLSLSAISIVVLSDPVDVPELPALSRPAFVVSFGPPPRAPSASL